MKPKQVRTRGIILSRTDFGEADRIITFLTPDYGKVRLIAKAVRKSKSKLAGGIELFSVSDIVYVMGRGDINTVTSTRLVKHYGNIVKSLEATQAAYLFMKFIDKATEDNAEADYFHLLDESLESLDAGVATMLVEAWFMAQLLRLNGHAPNLHDNGRGRRLDVSSSYEFDYDQMLFVAPGGREELFTADHIKFMRLCFSLVSPKKLALVSSTEGLIESVRGLEENILSKYVRV